MSAGVTRVSKKTNRKDQPPDRWFLINFHHVVQIHRPASLKSTRANQTLDSGGQIAALNWVSLFHVVRRGRITSTLRFNFYRRALFKVFGGHTESPIPTTDAPCKGTQGKGTRRSAAIILQQFSISCSTIHWRSTPRSHCVFISSLSPFEVRGNNRSN